MTNKERRKMEAWNRCIKRNTKQKPILWTTQELNEVSKIFIDMAIKMEHETELEFLNDLISYHDAFLMQKKIKEKIKHLEKQL